jgi:hypothetical protein
MVTAEFDPRPQQAYAALEKAGPAQLLDAIDDAIDALENDPGSAAVRRGSLSDGLRGIPVRDRTDHWLIIWERGPPSHTSGLAGRHHKRPAISARHAGYGLDAARSRPAEHHWPGIEYDSSLNELIEIDASSSLKELQAAQAVSQLPGPPGPAAWALAD